MKSLCIVILILMLASCGQIKREMSFIKDAKAAIGNTEWLSLEIVVYTDLFASGRTSSSFSLISYFGDKDSFYVVNNRELMRSVMIKENEILVVDGMSRELCCFTESKDGKTVWFEQIGYETAKQLEYLPFYTVLYPNQIFDRRWIPMINRIADTTIQNAPYRKYEALHSPQRLYNDETEQFDMPLRYKSIMWMNLNTNQLDSVAVFPITNNGLGTNRHFHIVGMSKEDKSDYIDSLFNFDNLVYQGYSRHSESSPPVSRLGSSNQTIDETLQQFFFTNLNQETISLSECDGWVLLDLWQFFCSSCYHGFEQLQKEKDSLGIRELESNGIRVVAANARSDNMDLLEKVAEKYDMYDLVYAGKGIACMLSLVNQCYPSYYLISPEKDIVWRSNYLDDYSELLEAKANYEHHKN